MERVVGSPSVTSAFEILDTLASSSGPMSMSDIVRKVDLPKSTAFRLLRALESVNAVTRDGRTKRYSLGRKLNSYAHTSEAPSLVSSFMENAGPILRPLDETVQLGVLAGLNVTFIACIDSTQPVRFVSFVGRTIPANASATGKAILAFSPQEHIEAVIAGGMPALTERTITDPQTLRTELATVRDRGYATEAEESVLNLSCLAAPIFGQADDVIGAVTACIPQSTLPTHRLDEIRTAVLTASARISNPEAALTAS